MHRKTWVLIPWMGLLLAACSQKLVFDSQKSAGQPMSGDHTMADMTARATATPGSRMAESSMGHGMEPIAAKNIQPAASHPGGQPIAFREENDTKVFERTAKVVQRQILDGVAVNAYTYNGTVPGPMIRVIAGDHVRVVVKNGLEVPTSVHFHGIQLPNSMDGVPDVTQKAIQPEETFTYAFTANPAGTYWYHAHLEGDVQVSAGLYAPFLIDPKTPAANPPDVDVDLMLGETLYRNGQTYAAMPMSGMEPNDFTINGKAFPSTETIHVKKGQKVRLRLFGAGQFIHPMHLHGMSFKVTATDGQPVPEVAQLTKDTISVAPGERYDIAFTASEPGKWMLHCQILHHTTNDNVEPGGLMLVVNVTE